MVFVHARNATVKTALTLREMANNQGDAALFRAEPSPEYGAAEKQVFNKLTLCALVWYFLTVVIQRFLYFLQLCSERNTVMSCLSIFKDIFINLHDVAGKVSQSPPMSVLWRKKNGVFRIVLECVIFLLYYRGQPSLGPRPTQRSNPGNEIVNNRNLVSGLEIFPNELAVSVPGVDCFQILMSFQ